MVAHLPTPWYFCEVFAYDFPIRSIPRHAEDMMCRLFERKSSVFVGTARYSTTPVDHSSTADFYFF